MTDEFGIYERVWDEWLLDKISIDLLYNSIEGWGGRGYKK